MCIKGAAGTIYLLRPRCRLRRARLKPSDKRRVAVPRRHNKQAPRRHRVRDGPHRRVRRSQHLVLRPDGTTHGRSRLRSRKRGGGSRCSVRAPVLRPPPAGSRPPPPRRSPRAAPAACGCPGARTGPPGSAADTPSGHARPSGRRAAARVHAAGPRPGLAAAARTTHTKSERPLRASRAALAAASASDEHATALAQPVVSLRRWQAGRHEHTSRPSGSPSCAGGP